MNRSVPYVLMSVLLVNAVGLLFFRYFITIDGPTHVLHASLVGTPWAVHGHDARGFTYGARLSSLGDLPLNMLLGLTTPERAHDIFAALLSCSIIVALVSYMLAHGTKIGPAILWLAPLALNTLLIMGLFHFLLGVAIAFGTVAWWKWHRAKPRIRWLGALVGIVLAWSTHRSTVPLLCLLLLPSFLLEMYEEHKTYRYRREVLGKRWLAPTMLVLVFSAFQGIRVLRMIEAPIPHSLPVFNEAVLWKPLFILDRSKEEPIMIGMGALFLLSLSAAALTRWRLGRQLLWHDTLIVVAVGFGLLTWFNGTPHGRRLLVPDRASWATIVMLVLWVIAMADRSGQLGARVIGGAALCTLPLNMMRLLHVERSLARLENDHHLAMEAGCALEPNSVVFSVMAGADRLQQHVQAFVAVKYSGVLVAPDEHIGVLTPPNEMNSTGTVRFTRDRNWLLRHWREGIPKEMDQVLFIGDQIERTVSRHPWPVLLRNRYRPTFDNGYARVYTSIRDRPAE